MNLRTLLIVPAVAAVSVTASANLLNNPSFESELGFDFADTSNWNGFFGGPEGAALEAFNDTGAPAFDGNNALTLSIFAGTNPATNATNSFAGHAQLVGGIVPGETYTLSWWSRNNGSALTGNAEARIEWRDANGEIARNDNNDPGLTDIYQQFSITAVAPAGAIEANVVFAVATFNQDVPHDISFLVDQVTLVPEPASAALLVLAGLAAMRRRQA